LAKCGQGSRVDIEAGKRIAHGVGQLPQPRAAGFNADQRRKGRLFLRRILACSLAEAGAVTFYIQQVVADLERQAQRIGIPIQRDEA
jgi:hypothetical protein